LDRISLPERPDWRAKADELGFTFADMHGAPYWDESSAYAFTLAEVEGRIEDPCTELHAMCREAVARILADEALMLRMGLPRLRWDFIRDSWAAAEPEVYGRFDLAYDGKGPAKLLEYNADTPTSLYESASFQWLWYEDQLAARVLPEGSDQFNRIHEALVERFAEIFPPDTDLHFAAIAGAPEDYATVETMAWAAREAGMGAHYTDIEKIGISDMGQFTDAEDRVIGTLFKLYPWEDLFADDFSAHLATSQCRFIEPAWKALLSNKAILPVLWQMYPGHPNLLPAFFADDQQGLADAAHLMLAGHVTKPLFSREGASVTITAQGRVLERAANRDYDRHPMIVQAYHPLPVMGGMRPVIGAWVVGETCVGMGVREDRALITQDLSRFKPHFIEG
jgi:glutathionylspermidine synthase